MNLTDWLVPLFIYYKNFKNYINNIGGANQSVKFLERNIFVSMSEQEWIDIFGDNLRDILKEYGYTQRDLADALGVSEITISRYVNKQRMPTLKMAINMSLELGIELDELVIFDERIE